MSIRLNIERRNRWVDGVDHGNQWDDYGSLDADDAPIEPEEKKKKLNFHTGNKFLILILGLFIVLICNLVLPIEIGFLIISIPIIILAFILKEKDDYFNMGILIIGMIMLGMFALIFYGKLYLVILEDVSIGFNTIENMLVGIIIILPLIIVILASYSVIFAGREDVYIRNGDSENREPTRLGKYISTEQIGVFYKLTFKKRYKFTAFYSGYPIHKIRNNFSFSLLPSYYLSPNLSPNNNPLIEDLIITKGFRYQLYKIFCSIIPFCSKLKYKLYNKLPKETKEITEIQILRRPAFSSSTIIVEQEINQEFKINDFLTLKLIENKTELYINDKYFQQCKFLLMNIPKENIREYDDIDSIDEMSENLDRSLEISLTQIEYNIAPEEEFQGHCSNLQAWYENNYDTRLLHSNLSFPLLRRLTEAGDPLAKKVFKEEIALRLESGYEPVITYLIEEKYLQFLNDEELFSLLNDILFYTILSKIILQMEIQNKPLQTYTNHNFIFKNFYVHSLSILLGINPSALLRIIKEIHSKSIYEVHYVSTVEELNRVKYMKRNNLDKLLVVIIDDAIDDTMSNVNSRRSMHD